MALIIAEVDHCYLVLREMIWSGVEHVLVGFERPQNLVYEPWNTGLASKTDIQQSIFAKVGRYVLVS